MSVHLNIRISRAGEATMGPPGSASFTCHGNPIAYRVVHIASGTSRSRVEVFFWSVRGSDSYHFLGVWKDKTTHGALVRFKKSNKCGR